MELLNSKKFQMAILAALLAFLGSYLGFSTEQVLTVISPLLTAIGGQALADLGKEAVKVKSGHQAATPGKAGPDELG